MYQFPEIFITGQLPTNWCKESLIADGLCGWACCMAGANPPEKFGEGMVLICSKVGAATPDELLKLSDELLDNK